MNENLSWLRQEIAPLRRQLAAHGVYAQIDGIDGLRAFLRDHVFAVWDFMSLLKALQNHLTCTQVPWSPGPYALSRRLINEIVLGEESDLDIDGGYLSHFELYRRAMIECGADTGPIDRFLQEIQAGEPVFSAIQRCGASAHAQAFVKATFQTIETGKPHVIAAAFAFGREDVIPDMFRALIEGWTARFPERFRTLRYYLARHIDVDENSHGPMALAMMEELCGGSAVKWREAAASVAAAIQARIALWDGIALPALR